MLDSGISTPLSESQTSLQTTHQRSLARKIMNEESSNSTSEKSFLAKIGQVFSPNPKNCDDVADMLRSAENESIIDASVLQIMEGALKSPTSRPGKL